MNLQVAILALGHAFIIGGQAQLGTPCGVDGECCSWPQADTAEAIGGQCCGYNVAGSSAIKCIDGRCQRGSDPCISGHAHPACNVASSDSYVQKGYAECKKLDVVGDDVYGGSPLARAVVSGNAALVRDLLSKGHDVNERSNGGATPLHMAGMSGPGQDVAALLLELGADHTAVDAFGYLPLHRFAHNRFTRGARALLEAGANANARGRGGNAPLHLACMDNDGAMAGLLLEFGAEPGLLDGRGRRAFQLGLHGQEGRAMEIARQVAAAAAGGARGGRAREEKTGGAGEEGAGGEGHDPDAASEGTGAGAIKQAEVQATGDTGRDPSEPQRSSLSSSAAAATAAVSATRKGQQGAGGGSGGSDGRRGAGAGGSK